MKERKTFSVYMTAELEEKIKALAASQPIGVSTNKLLLYLIELGLKTHLEAYPNG